MTENFPNLAKKIDIQFQEVQSPKQDEPKETHTGHIIIKMPKFKHKEKIAAREKQLVMYRGVPITLSADFLKETAG